jgi:hypothetical protein
MQFSGTVLSDSVVDLRGAHIGELHAVPTCLPGRLYLNGLTYYPPHSSAGPAHAQFQPVYAFYAVVPVLNIGQPNPYPVSAPG